MGQSFEPPSAQPAFASGSPRAIFYTGKVYSQSQWNKKMRLAEQNDHPPISPGFDLIAPTRTCQLHQQRAQTLSKSKVDGVAVEARYQHHQAGNRDESIGTCYSGGESSGTCWRVSLGAPLVYSHNCSYMYARMYGAARL